MKTAVLDTTLICWAEGNRTDRPDLITFLILLVSTHKKLCMLVSD